MHIEYGYDLSMQSKACQFLKYMAQSSNVEEDEHTGVASARNAVETTPIAEPQIRERTSTMVSTFGSSNASGDESA